MKAIVRWLFGMALWVGMMFLLFDDTCRVDSFTYIMAVWAFGD